MRAAPTDRSHDSRGTALVACGLVSLRSSAIDARPRESQAGGTNAIRPVDRDIERCRELGGPSGEGSRNSEPTDRADGGPESEQGIAKADGCRAAGCSPRPTHFRVTL